MTRVNVFEFKEKDSLLSFGLDPELKEWIEVVYVPAKDCYRFTFKSKKENGSIDGGQFGVPLDVLRNLRVRAIWDMKAERAEANNRLLQLTIRLANPYVEGRAINPGFETMNLLVDLKDVGGFRNEMQEMVFPVLHYWELK